jgi:hypothetical protein
MRKLAVLFAALALVAVGPAALAEDNLGPCNDADGDGSPSGHEYSAHHIVPANKANRGAPHVPGTHRGFSLCIELPDPAQPEDPGGPTDVPKGSPEFTPVARGLAHSAAPHNASDTGKAHGRAFAAMIHY